MGILDDAIREHLDLKRRHGAREGELREIEDEAFGSGDQPDPFAAGDLYGDVASAEAPPAETAPPDFADLGDVGNEEPTRLVEPEAPESLRPTEAPEPEAVPPEEPAEPEALRPEEPAPPEPPSTTEQAAPPEPGLPEPPSEPEGETFEGALGGEPPSPIPGQVELPGQDEIPGQERLDAEPEPPSPSESLEELIAEEEPFPEDTAAPTTPSAEPEAEVPEPESRPLEPEPEAQAPPEPAVPDPPPPPPSPGSEPPGRARGRVDVPTQEHPPPGDTGDLPSLPGDEPELGRPDTTYEPPPMEEPPSEEPPSEEQPVPADDASESDGGPQLYDFETDEDPIAPPAPRSAVDDDFEALGPAEEEKPYLDEEEPYPEEPASGTEPRNEEPGTEVRPAPEEDEPYDEGASFEESFEEEEEGEEDLWFEKGPPKDFDFDD